MWGSGQEIVSRVRATGVKQGNRKLFLSLSLCREDFRPVFRLGGYGEKGFIIFFFFFFFRENRMIDK